MEVIIYIILCRHAWADLKHRHAERYSVRVLYQLPMSVISETGLNRFLGQ